MLRATALALSILIAPQARAAGIVDWVSGNSLTENCRTDAFGFCLGYIMGVTAGASSDRSYCLPPGVTGDQLRDIVMLYLTAHPERRQLGGSFLIVDALKEKFPCSGLAPVPDIMMQPAQP
jgi:hypothetical protein